jgi:hypothetical protein
MALLRLNYRAIHQSSCTNLRTTANNPLHAVQNDALKYLARHYEDLIHSKNLG